MRRSDRSGNSANAKRSIKAEQQPKNTAKNGTGPDAKKHGEAARAAEEAIETRRESDRVRGTGGP